MKNNFSLLAGIVSPLIFWITLFICGMMLDDYSHLSGLVSELGALGTRSQYFFSIGLVLCSVLNLVFAIQLIVLCRQHKLSVWPAVLLVFFSALAGPAIVPMPLPLHGIIGLPMFLFFLSPPAGLILWRNRHPDFNIGIVAIISIIFIALGFLIYSQNLLGDYFGLKQRFMYLGWSIWSTSLTFTFWQIKSSNKRKNIDSDS